MTLEKVKKVKVGRRRREGWLVMILMELHAGVQGQGFMTSIHKTVIVETF